MNTATSLALELSKTTQMAVYGFACHVYQHRRDLNGVREHAKICLALANELGDVFHRPWGEIYLG
jgi:hypothetical protein